MRPRIVALGDSVTTGVGDAVSPGLETGWVTHLARLVGASEVRNLARMGARARDVLGEQVPQVRPNEAELVTLLVGGNDVLRKDFDAVRIGQTVRDICAQFSASTTVVLVLLHDPRRVLPTFAGDAGRVIARRAAAVNDQVRRVVASDESVIVVDISTEPGAHDLCNWHIDRMHPSPIGHRWLASVVANALAERGLATIQGYQDPVPPTPRRWVQLAWFITAGVPWAIKRSVDLLPELISVIVVERRQLRLDAHRTNISGPDMKQGPHNASLASGDPDRARTGDLRRDRAAR